MMHLVYRGGGLVRGEKFEEMGVAYLKWGPTLRITIGGLAPVIANQKLI